MMLQQNMKHTISFILILVVFLALIPFVQATDIRIYYIMAETDDGHVWGQNADYEIAHSTGSATLELLYIGQKLSDSTYYVYRSFLKFDTSTIIDTNQIIEAKLYLYQYSDYSTDDFYFRVQKWTGDTPINISDFTEFDGINYDDGLKGSSNWGSAWNYINITDFSLINKTGDTKICLRSSEDIEESPPTTLEYFGFRDYNAFLEVTPYLEIIITGEHDFVDDNTSNVDSLANKGSQSNFTTQQYCDDIYDNITEETIAGEDYEDFTSYTEGGAEAGQISQTSSRASWTVLERQDEAYLYKSYNAGHFGDFEHLLDVNVTENEAGDSDSRTMVVFWCLTNATGAFPALPTNTLYVDSRQIGTSTTTYHFRAGNKGVVVWETVTAFNVSQMYYLRIYRTGTTFYCEVYATNEDRESKSDYIEIEGGSAHSNTFEYLQVTSSVDSSTDPNDDSTGYVENLDIQESVSHYEVNLELQWLNVDYSQPHGELCIKTGVFNGTEDLQVKVWNITGSSWHWVMNLTASSENNVSIIDYLVNETFTILLLGGLETVDAIQDMWQIDCSLLHLWGVWYQVESWYGSLVGRQWVAVESWFGEFLTMQWNLVETWYGQLIGKSWSLVEVWYGQIVGKEWKLIETWYGEFVTKGWNIVESWYGEFATKGWHEILTWYGIVEDATKAFFLNAVMLGLLVGGSMFLIILLVLFRKKR